MFWAVPGRWYMLSEANAVISQNIGVGWQGKQESWPEKFVAEREVGYKSAQQITKSSPVPPLLLAPSLHNKFKCRRNKNKSPVGILPPCPDYPDSNCLLCDLPRPFV